MIDKLKKITSKQIISFTAIFLVFLFVLSGLFNWSREMIARKNGTLRSETLSVNDFEIIGMIPVEDRLKSTDYDPQLVLNENMKITSVRFYMESSMFPGEMTLYYTRGNDAGFSERKRVWATPIQGSPDWYMIDMPMKEVTSFRIDPTMYAGNEMKFGDFIINEEVGFMNYFEISYGTIFNFIVYTGLISSVVKYFVELINRKFD